MRTSNFKKILYFFIFILIFIPSFSSAQSRDTSITLPANSNATPQPNTGGFTYTSLVKLPGLGNDGVVTISPDSLGSYLQTVFNYVIGISIFLATVVVVYGGFLYATTDAISTKQEGKKIIQDAFIGLGLALSSWLILYTINPDLLKFDLSIERASLPTGTDGGTGSLVAIQSGGGMTVVLSGGDANGEGSTYLNVSGAALDNKNLAMQIARQYGLDPILFACQIGRESGFRPNLTSEAGAQGIGQILPGTARQACPGKNVFDPRQGLECAASIMRTNSRTYTPYANALAAYNGGPGAVLSSRDCPGKKRWECEWDNPEHTVRNTGFAETRNYIKFISNCAAANGASVSGVVTSSPSTQPTQ